MVAYLLRLSGFQADIAVRPDIRRSILRQRLRNHGKLHAWPCLRHLRPGEVRLLHSYEPRQTGARALVVDYRRSPKHKFPAQIEDMEKAYHWLLAKGIRAENIAVTGQSIGANLAVSLSIELRNKGVAMPAAILSVSAWYDMELKNDTIKSKAKNDKLLSRSILERFREAWLADTGTAWNDPRVNLLYADLAGLPPIQLYYGDHELFVGEIVEFAKRAKDAGVDVGIHSVSEGQHNFILGAGRVPEVDEAIEQMGQWLRSRL